MNILKHMEAVFIASALVAVGGSQLADLLPKAQAKSAVVASAEFNAHTPVVVVKARRMSPEEKRQSLQADDRLAGVRDQASRI